MTHECCPGPKGCTDPSQCPGCTGEECEQGCPHRVGSEVVGKYPKRPWTQGPWFTNGFRHVMAAVEKNHPLQWWPDCSGKAGDGRFDCDEDCKSGCEFSENCKDEWENHTPLASVVYIKNPEGYSQGDQIVHGAVRGNVELIALAPEMAEALLLFDESDHCVGIGKDPQPGCEDCCVCMVPAYSALEVVAGKLRQIKGFS